ncbi:hypothetical protein LR48_Vigan03g111700 [Vigna angularis]|uniref:Uncharacterized protein n=1 Tax=Phaseolus angularis TaxID=3914 RepID=A0A0L9U4L9_PHAAN|nr:hypothetical protein LR48_Vigan03g111700 [Vigna angularis]
MKVPLSEKLPLSGGIAGEALSSKVVVIESYYFESMNDFAQETSRCQLLKRPGIVHPDCSPFTRHEDPPPRRFRKEYSALHSTLGNWDVRAELLAEKKIYEDLRAAMEQVLLAQDESDKKNNELQVELDEVKEELAETTDWLRDAWANYDRLVDECRQLKVVVDDKFMNNEKRRQKLV